MGCVMGIVCAPSYNNLFMAQFGEKHIYPYIIDMPRFYLRYIDDVFFLKLGFTLCNSEQPLRIMTLQEKEAQKD